MVEKHIKSLLYDHDCVIIPDFGGLITRYVSARINPVKHSFLPPSKKVAFNEKLVMTDGLLVSTIAYKNQVSKEEAQQLVKEFVHRAKATLQQENRFVLQDIGTFKYTTEQKLEFEYVEADNMLDASFGLPELTVRPIRFEEPAVLRTLKKDNQQELIHAKRPFKSRLKRVYNVAAGLALTGLTASALYFFSLQADYNLSSLNPMLLLNQSFNTGNSAEANKFADDYVPFTAEERFTNYKALLPVSIPVLEAAPEELITEEVDAWATSDTSDASTEVAVNEEAISESVIEQPTKSIAETAQTIKENSKRFYIITGGYSTSLSAENGLFLVQSKGYEQAKLLAPGKGSRLFRVSVADFGTQDEAQAALDKYKSTFGETIWVYKN
ncbi:HU domain-containing protein [Pontibacter sp. H249]|uniref:HU domain-containing protein n=1 Tax=Pontibacter sp. H249 TaxID=3133420 RepID=UPI0030BE178F